MKNIIIVTGLILLCHISAQTTPITNDVEFQEKLNNLKADPGKISILGFTIKVGKRFSLKRRKLIRKKENVLWRNITEKDGNWKH